MTMTKGEAVAVNVLMRALGVAPSQSHGDLAADDDPKTIAAAIDTLACSASRTLGAGVRQGDVATWHASGPVVPTADLLRVLHAFRAGPEAGKSRTQVALRRALDAATVTA